MSDPVAEQRVTLEDIAAGPASGKKPDEATKQEQEDWDQQEKRARVLGLFQDIEQRKEYAHRIFCLICVWLGLVFVVLGFQGVGRITLSDSVLITLITGTTVNVIGIFLVVANYLFPKPKD